MDNTRQNSKVKFINSNFKMFVYVYNPNSQSVKNEYAALKNAVGKKEVKVAVKK